jgi:hypothetical protein
MNIDFDLDNLETGDILLYHASDFWFSSLVEWFTGSQFSHVSMVLKEPQFTTPPLKGLYIFESGEENIPDAENGRNKFGVQIVPFEEAIKGYMGKIYLRKMTCTRDTTFYENLTKAHSNVHNITYDVNPIDMIKAITHNYTGKTQKETSYWCSALQSYLLVQLGFLLEDTPWTLIVPKQFSSTCLSSDKLQFKNCELANDLLIYDSNN